MNVRKRQQAHTRQAILDALADVIANSGATGFSVQEVADRAGVTHRTVYNHFPTRAALNDGFAVHVEEELAKLADPRGATLNLAKLAPVVAELYRVVSQRASHVRAYVMLMIASRAPAKVTRDRTAQFERLVEDEAGPLPAGAARLVTASLRMFVSSTAWHLLTEHQGLSTEEAARAAQWATKTLLAAVANGDYPQPGDRT
ncbi:MAG: TetR/AcrR family transcriptional regulator [Candidatus Latescibacteria bacterium]|nr:TetR/AcrR family transcriptional regulator [Candidatus Latescibacterota bacterium]